MKTILLFLILLPIASNAGPVIDSTWSPRILPNGSANPSLEEGGLGVTLSSDEPVSLVSPVSGLQYQGTNTWYYVFPWDWTDPLVASFIDAVAETTTISLTPQLATPFRPSDHSLPVINVSTSPAGLWDPETGIYVFGNYDNCLLTGSDWETPAAFQWYEGAEEPVFTEQIGLRINGDWSRHLDQKGLRFYFDDYGQSNAMDYDFFGSDPTSYQRLIIRTGRDPFRCFNAVVCESIFQELGHLGSRSRDVAVYLNREYWGFYTLRERLDTSFVEHTLGYGDAPYDMIKDGVVKHGSVSSWWGFLVSFDNEEPRTSHAWYEEACQKLDMTSYIDWQILNIIVGSTDNHGDWNLVLLRLENEPWQFVMWDEDMVFIEINLETDLFRFRSIINQIEFYEYLPPSTPAYPSENYIRWGKMFSGLMENSEFKELFRQRYELLTNGMLSTASLQERITAISVSQGTEIQRHAERWNWDSPDDYHDLVAQELAWIEQREPLNHQHYLDFIEYRRDPVEFIEFSGTDGGTEITLEWQTASEEMVGGYRLYRGNQPDNLSLIAEYKTTTELVATGGIWEPGHYSYTDTDPGTQRPLYYKLSWVNPQSQEQEIEWILEIEDPPVVPNLVINEYLALNTSGIVDETGTCEDWCEIFNAGDQPAQLGQLYLTDNVAEPTKWAFPETTLPAGGFLIVWCDSDPEDGPLHTNFKLNASGESLSIFNSLAQGNGVIDTRVFGAQQSDTSEGFCQDGGGEYCTFAVPTPGFPNNDTSSASSIPREMLHSVFCSPNPFNPATEIQFNLGRESQVTVAVYDLYGRTIRKLCNGQVLGAGQHSMAWDGKDDTGRLVPSGTYLSQVETRDARISIKMQLVK